MSKPVIKDPNAIDVERLHDDVWKEIEPSTIEPGDRLRMRCQNGDLYEYAGRTEWVSISKGMLIPCDPNDPNSRMVWGFQSDAGDSDE